MRHPPGLVADIIDRLRQASPDMATD